MNAGASQPALPIASEADLVGVRREVRRLAQAQGLGLVDQTRLITAVSELARNALVHGGGGQARIEPVEASMRRGVRVTIGDRGAGIPDLERAYEDGFSTMGGLGLGLGGARRLLSELQVETSAEGTTCVAVRWAQTS